MTGTERAISIEDVRRKARRIADMAEAEARRALTTDVAKKAAIAAALAVAAIGLAYYAGSRRRCS